MPKKKKSATKKILLIVGGLIILLVLLGIGASAMGGGSDAMAVETAAVTSRTITQVVTASGKVQPEVQVVISPDVSGEIIELPVREGDYVERGRLLARIEPDIYRQQVAQQVANVHQQQAARQRAEASLLQAEAVFERQEKLYERNAISESQYQEAQTSLDIAKAGYEASRYSLMSAQARLEQSREQLGKTAIYAPMDGTVSMLNVERGERVVGTSQRAGTAMMQIARLDRMEMMVDVNENDVVNVALGDTAKLLIDAFPDRIFAGVVTSIAHSARVTGEGTQEQVTNFPVKIRILGIGLEGDGATQSPEIPATPVVQLRPGMSGAADIRTETVANAPAVPIQAVTVRDFSQIEPGDQAGSESDTAAVGTASNEEPALFAEEDLREVVFVVENGEAQIRQVQTGISDATHLVIVAGLQDGEKVIIGPYRAVSRELEHNMTVDPDASPWRAN